MKVHARLPALLGTVLGFAATAPVAQGQASDSLATLRVRVVRDSVPLAGARVTALRQVAETGGDGVATLRLAPDTATVVVSGIAFRPATVRLALRPGLDTSVTVNLEPQAVVLPGIVVAATRSERRVEDTPLRVEIVDEEEVAEKVAMTPGDIAMMLNETSGLRVQTTSPSLGGASVRVQGLRGRYTLMLADGLPLYGGQAGGLGLLQTPPLDLSRVEVIKGTASALYGSSALGGVVNLLSRRPGDLTHREVLVNQTSRGGTDGVLYLGLPLGGDVTPWGATMLISAHRQRTNDLDADGWADMAGYRRLVVRPRLFYDTPSGGSAFATIGYTAEQRDGGTLPGRLAPDGAPFPEGLRTRRADFAVAARALVGEGHRDILSIRASGMRQRHTHRFGPVREGDRHGTWFAEASLAMPRGAVTTVIGGALQEDRYRHADVPGFDYAYRIPAAFAQLDVDAAPWLVLSGSARLDAHSEYGTVISPRLSALLRIADDDAAGRWTARLSGGSGAFAPIPFTEETEVTGLAPLRPLRNLALERALSGSFDVNGALDGALGRIEINATVFGSRITDPVTVVRDTGVTQTGASFMALANAPLATTAWGAEILARLLHEPVRITTNYVYLRSREWDPEAAGVVNRAAPLVPRHAAGVVASWEQEGRSRIGIELYYTGAQPLEDNPYRATSRPYLVVGFLLERIVPWSGGQARLFVNAENVGDVRQTDVHPLVRPTRGTGGRWTTDAWTELSGFTVNGGVRLAW